MILQESDEQLNGWARSGQLPSDRGLGSIINLTDKTLVIAEFEIRKLVHDPSDLVLRAVQPALWLLIFGQVFTRIRAIPTGSLSYLDFLAPGILAQSVLFVAIFSAMNIIWERDLGIVHKFLASPTPRTSLVLGKAIAAGIKSLAQATIVYLLTLILGVHLNLNLIAIMGMILIVMIGASCFSLFSLMVACLVKTRERFMGIGQLMTMPLFFASNAIYPITIMPSWLQVLSHLNPLTYQVDALRGLMIKNGTSIYGFGVDCSILLLTTTTFTVICSRLYPRIVM